MNNIPLIQCTTADQIPADDHPMHWLSIQHGYGVAVKPYFHFDLAVKSEETEESGWDLAVKADFVTPVISSHNGFAIGRTLAKHYSHYDNIHSIKVWIKDYSTDVFDEWHVVYLSKCRSIPRSFTHPAPRSFRSTVLVRFVRHCDSTQTKWHWS